MNAAIRARGDVPGRAGSEAAAKARAARKAAKEAGKVPEVGSYPPRDGV